MLAIGAHPFSNLLGLYIIVLSDFRCPSYTSYVLYAFFIIKHIIYQKKKRGHYFVLACQYKHKL